MALISDNHRQESPMLVFQTDWLVVSYAHRSRGVRIREYLRQVSDWTMKDQKGLLPS